MQIALATCLAWPDLLASDAALRDALVHRGHTVVAVPWNGLVAPFMAADAVILRACWDYHEDPPAFLAWLDDLEHRKIPTLNPPTTVRWNFDKSYILELDRGGVRVPKTFIVESGDRAEIASIMDRAGWSEAILKPISGQSGFHVGKIHRDRPDLWHGDEIPTDKSLVQEFEADIGEYGETTLVFFAGDFSHATRRIIPPGDWRANSQFGARQEAVTVTTQTIAQARAALDIVPTSHLYARVDGIVRGEDLTVMEVELIEPGLYLHLAPGSADRFADAIEIWI